MYALSLDFYDVRFLVARKINRKYIKEENKIMESFAKQFIGKLCIIYSMSSSLSTVEGTIKDVQDNGILLKDKKNRLQIINMDYVTRIQEKTKNKKEIKSVFELD